MPEFSALMLGQCQTCNQRVEHYLATVSCGGGGGGGGGSGSGSARRRGGSGRAGVERWTSMIQQTLIGSVMFTVLEGEYGVGIVDVDVVGTARTLTTRRRGRGSSER